MSKVSTYNKAKVEKVTVDSYNPDIVGIHLHPFQHSSNTSYPYKSAYLEKHLPDYLPRKVGRPSKATAETFDKVIEGIRNRLSYVRVANNAGITYQTFNAWKKKGEVGVYPFAGFLYDLKQAERDAEAERIAAFDAYLIKSGKMSMRRWQDSAKFLERRYPDDFGRKPRSFIHVDEW